MPFIRWSSPIPESGRKALYVNPGFTLRFDGWSDDESRPLLDYLYRHAAKPNSAAVSRGRKARSRSGTIVPLGITRSMTTRVNGA